MKTRVAQVQGFVFGACVTAVIFVAFPLLMLRQEGSNDVNEIEWQTVTVGGVVTFEVPAACSLGSGTKAINLVCPTDENPEPLPEMTFWIEGDTVSVRRYENLETPYWDHIVASMEVTQPMTRDITINIQK